MERNIEHIRGLLAQLLENTGLIPFTNVNDGEPGSLRYSVFTDGYTASVQVDRFGVTAEHADLGDVRNILVMDPQQFRQLLIENFSQELVGIYMHQNAADQFFMKVNDNLNPFCIQEPNDQVNEQDLVPPDQFAPRQGMLFEEFIGNLPIWFVQRMFLSPDAPVTISFKASFSGQLYLECRHKGEHLNYCRIGSLKRLSKLSPYALEQTLLDTLPLPILFFDSFVQTQELPAALLDKTSPYYQDALRNSELSATPLRVSSMLKKGGDYILKVEEEGEIGKWELAIVDCKNPASIEMQHSNLRTRPVTISGFQRSFVVARGFYKNYRIVSYVFQLRERLIVSSSEIIF